MKKQICMLSLLTALIAWSCGTYVSDAPLTRAQVERSVTDLDAKLSAEIIQLDEAIRLARTQLTYIFIEKIIKIEAARQAQLEFMTADYYMARSWSSLVEKNPNARALLDAGQEAFKRGIEVVLKAAQVEIERRSI